MQDHYKYRYALPQNEYREKPIPPGKIWKYFLSLLRSCGELWLQQTWEMIVVTECLQKGLFYAKQLSLFGIKSKEPCVSEVEQFIVFFWQSMTRLSRLGLQLLHPSSQWRVCQVILCKQTCWQLAIFEDWKYFVTNMGHPEQYSG